MHSSSTHIGAYIRTVTPDGKVQGYPPSVLTAGTDYGDAFTYDGAKSLTLTVATGAATGSPTEQTSTVSLQSSADGAEWSDVADSTVALTGDEKAGEVDVNLTALPAGHGKLRAKVVTAFTGGSSPKQSVAAIVTLGGFGFLPV